MIMCGEALAKSVDKAIFPGLQGGPLMHVIAAKAVAFREALQPDFKDYAQAVIDNARAMASTLQDRGYRIVTGGTDFHGGSVFPEVTIGCRGSETGVIDALRNAAESRPE